MQRFDILQRIVELTRAFVPPPRWNFLTRSAKVRSLDSDAFAVLASLEEEFPVHELMAARVVVPASNGGNTLSPVLAEDGAPILVLARDPEPRPFDLVNHHGSLVATDPPSFHAPCDTHSRAVSGKTRRVLAAFSSTDLALLSLLGLPSTPAAGLERMTDSQIRRLFNMLDVNGQSTVAANSLAPVCREDFSVVLVNWNVTALRCEESTALQDIVARIADAVDAYGPAAIPRDRFKIWQPSLVELRNIQRAVALGETAVVRQRMWHSIFRSSSGLSGYDAAARSRQQSTDYCSARRELLDAVDQGNNISRAEVAARIDALDRTYNQQFVQPIVRDAMTTENPMQRVLLLGAAELASSWHESSDLVNSAQAIVACHYSSSADASTRPTLQERLRIVDGIVRIHRELMREP